MMYEPSKSQILAPQLDSAVVSVSKIDSTRLSIFDLPGELRNDIYQHLLLSYTPSNTYLAQIASNPVCIVIGKRNRWMEEGGAHRSVMNKLATNLTALALVCRQIRIESRAYFFSRNDFCLFARGMGRLSDYTAFLEAIGSEARSNLTFLALLRYSGDFLCCSRSEYDNLFHTIESCTNLKALKLTVHVEYFVKTNCEFDDLGKDCGDKVETLVYGNRPLPQLTIGELANSIPRLAQHGNLKRLTVDCRYEFHKIERRMFYNHQSMGWGKSVRKFLRQELRKTLPDGVVNVKVRGGSPMS